MRNIGILILAASLTACTEVDCPLDNVVAATCTLYESESGSALTFAGVVSVTSEPTDVLLLNQLANAADFQLTLRQTVTTDTLRFDFASDEVGEVSDTVFLTHTNVPHFESVDCPAVVFHTLTAVTATHNLIDSVRIVRPTVDYEDLENFRIYMRTALR